MSKEILINNWLASQSNGRWQLVNNQCNLLDAQGAYYATILNATNRTVFMFPLAPDLQIKSEQLPNKLLQLNAHQDVVGIAAFSLAADNKTIVLNVPIADQALANIDLNEFWHDAQVLRNSLFEQIKS